MRHAIYRWLESHRWAGDALLATVLEIGTVLIWFDTLSQQQLIASCALLLPLYLRRTWPELVLGLTVVGALAQLTMYGGPLPGDVAVLLVVHAAAAYAGHHRWGLAALIAGLIGSVLAGISWIGIALPTLRELTVLVLAGMAAVLVSYLIGLRQRDGREQYAAELDNLRERNRLLATERDQRAELAAVSERTRTARELHDIVAHSLAVIVVQADGAAAAAAARPELAQQVLATIADTSREALAEMRQLVAVLRSGPTEPAGADYLPTPGPADLPDLVEQVRRAGVPVDLRVTGESTNLASGIGLTLYRLVQESLTNVIRHAGPAATVIVTVRFEPDLVAVAVSDNGRGPASFVDDAGEAGDGGEAGNSGEGGNSGDAGKSGEVGNGGKEGDAVHSVAPRSGHGLSGMRERVGLLAGNLRAGPRPGGGFLVEAELPVPRAQPVAPARPYPAGSGR